MSSDRITQLKSFLKDDPNDAFLLFALARELTKAERTNEALECYYSLRSIHSDYVGLYYHLGQLEEALDKADLARQTYLAGIEIAQAAGDMHARGELEGVLELLVGRH